MQHPGSSKRSIMQESLDRLRKLERRKIRNRVKKHSKILTPAQVKGLKNKLKELDDITPDAMSAALPPHQIVNTLLCLIREEALLYPLGSSERNAYGKWAEALVRQAEQLCDIIEESPQVDLIGTLPP